MSYKIISFAAIIAVARAGFIPETYQAPLQYAAPAIAKVAYSSAPAVSYSSISAPAAYAAAPAYKVAAPVAYAAPAYKVAAPVAYAAAPAYKVAAPVAYAAPAYKVAAPVAYAAPAYKVAAPVAYAAAPAYKVAAPVAYAAPAYKVAAPVAYAAPITKTIIAEQEAPANYDFGYAVNDPHTGDSKSQQESRHGDTVHGSYSLIEADGSKRTVEYTADAHNGFNAVVHKEPAAVHVKAVAPVAYAPVAKVAAPLAYAKVAAPVAYSSYPAAYAQNAYYH